MSLNVFASYALVLVSGHLLNSFLSYCIHYVQHQDFFGLGFHRLHQRAHHAHSDAPSTAREIFIGYALWAIGITAGCVAYLVLLPPWIAWIWIAEAMALTLFLYWIHDEYANSSSVLLRFRWFRRCRALHGIHHAPCGRFSSGTNYAIGGPVLGLLPDRVFSTFTPVLNPVSDR